jgi:uncharacterized protein
MAIELVKSGMTQSQAAKKLGVTPAAISQYIHKKRGLLSPKSKHYRQEIKEAVKILCSEEPKPDELRQMVCSCCHLLQKEADDVVCG